MPGGGLEESPTVVADRSRDPGLVERANPGEVHDRADLGEESDAGVDESPDPGGGGALTESVDDEQILESLDEARDGLLLQLVEGSEIAEDRGR